MQKIYKLLLIFLLIGHTSISIAEEENVDKIIQKLQKDIQTLERAVYSQTLNESSENLGNNNSSENIDEDVLTRHLLKLSEIERQFQELTNKFEEVNFKLDKLSSRVSKIQADNQLRFQQLENNPNANNSSNKKLSSTESSSESEKILPGSSQPQDLGQVSYKDTETNLSNQQTQSIDTTSTVVTENFITEEKILPKESPEKQYEFATSFLKVGDYTTAERAFREFVLTNPEHNLAGNAQYWYAETFRIRQLYTDAATAYLEGYQKYPKSDKTRNFISANWRERSRMSYDFRCRKTISKSKPISNPKSQI